MGREEKIRLAEGTEALDTDVKELKRWKGGGKVGVIVQREKLNVIVVKNVNVVLDSFFLRNAL